MKISKLLSAVAILSFIAACGGGSGGDTPVTPTTEEAKAIAGAAESAALAGFGDAMSNGFENFTPIADISAGLSSAKATPNYSGTIDLTKNCGDSEDSGTYTATGTLTANCTGDPNAQWSCTDFALQNFLLVFTNCQKSITVESTTYDEVMSGNVSAAITSANISGNGQTFTSMSVDGTLSGTPSLTGTVEGTVDLSSTTFNIGIVNEEPVPTCDGSASVTITAPASAAGTEDCSVNTTCDGCTQ